MQIRMSGNEFVLSSRKKKSKVTGRVDSMQIGLDILSKILKSVLEAFLVGDARRCERYGVLL